MQSDTPMTEDAPPVAAEDAALPPAEAPLPDHADRDESIAEAEAWPEPTRPDVQGKPFGIRAGAYILDLIVLNAVTFVGGMVGLLGFAALLAAMGHPLAPAVGRPLFTLTGLVISAMLSIAYFVLFEWLFGASPGKAILKMRVVSEDGGRPGLWSVLVRVVFRLFDGLVFGLPAYMVMGKHASRQRIGDRRAHTLVVGHRDPILHDQPSWAMFVVAAVVAVPVLSWTTAALALQDMRVSPPPVVASAADINLGSADVDARLALRLEQGNEAFADAVFKDGSVRVFASDDTTVESRVMIMSGMPSDTIDQLMTQLVKTLTDENSGQELHFERGEYLAIGDRAGIVQFSGLADGQEGYALLFIRRNLVGRLIVYYRPGAITAEEVIRLARAMDGRVR